MKIIQNRHMIETGNSSTSPVEVFDQTTDENGTTKFVRRGSTTGTGH